MKRAKQAVKEIQDKGTYTQERIAKYGLDYATSPNSFGLAFLWMDNLEELKERSTPVVVFKKGKPNSLELSAAEAIMEVVDIIHHSLETGNAEELRQFATAIETIHRDEVSDPVRYYMLRYAAARIGSKEFLTQKPLKVPFTLAEASLFLDKVGWGADKKTIRNAAQELGWILQPDKKGPKPGKRK